MTNKRNIAWIGLMLVIIGLALLSVSCGTFGSEYEYQGGLIDPPLPLPNFELKDTNGHDFRLSDVEGDLAVIYFGYTYCPDVCPLTLWDIKKTLAELPDRERIHVIFISVDPDRDTPEALARYIHGFDPEFIGLTDDYQKIEPVLKSFGAFAEKAEMTDTEAGYLVNHTARLFLVNPQGELLLTYTFGFEPEALRRDLQHLLQAGAG